MKALGNCYDVYCETHEIIWVHIAPPCGAASRARDRPMSATRFGPRPLRSVQVLWVYRDFMGQI